MKGRRLADHRWLARLTLALAALLGACAPRPQPAEPALWRIVGPDQREGWLFGTIHAAPAPLAWKTGAVSQALGRSDTIMVEVANIGDDAAVARTFAALARSPGLPPVEKRVGPGQRPALARMLADRHLAPEDLHDVETWAVALTLARPATGSETKNGVDRAVLAATKGKRVVELEGAAAQLAIFDRLPEAEQRDLLDAVLADASALDDEADLVAVWRRGDMARLEAETRTGLLADPELRDALYTRRNRRWTQRIAAEIRAGHRPFVAVGAAHMPGPDGLIAMLQQRGYAVTRID